MSDKVELIAEVASNHGGNLALAKEFIKRFAEAGADFVKFQHTRVKHLNPKDPQYLWFTRAELSVDQFDELKACCEAEGTQFLTTIYNVEDLPEVRLLGREVIKLGAGEWGDETLVRAVRALYPRVIQSWPFGSEYAAPHGHQLLTVVCRYPASSWISARTIDRLFEDGCVGYSDHCIGIEQVQHAIDLGATIIEKHVQLPNQARPEKAFEATVEEFKAMRSYADGGYRSYQGRWSHA